MASLAPFIVRVKFPPETTFGTAISQMREWLDANRIEHSTFRTVDGCQGLAFDLGFSSERDARLLEQAFRETK